MTEENSLTRLYAAWITALSELLTRRHSMARQWRTLLHHTPDGLEIYVREGRATKLVGTLTPDAGDEQAEILKSMLAKHVQRNAKTAVLRLAPTDVLHKTQQIPDTARDVIAQILDNQIERMVPWPNEHTRHGHRILSGNPSTAGQVDVEIVATRSEIVDDLLKRAGKIGIDPAVADFASTVEADASIELLSFLPDPTRRTAAVLNAAVMCFLAICVMVGGAGAYAWWERNDEQAALQAAISRANDRAEALTKLASENEHLREQRDQLIRKKQDEPAIMFLLEGLSRALPDTAYATEIEVQGREVKVVGKSLNASALITDLEDSPQFEDVRFSAPTTREPEETMETFAIVGRAQGSARIEASP